MMMSQWRLRLEQLQNELCIHAPYETPTYLTGSGLTHFIGMLASAFLSHTMIGRPAWLWQYRDVLANLG